ncbi:MAG: hypothetical protein IJZ33_08240 [Clostridia bacterium]|nr:hypothetical protein [Clostridia bacterium]
MAESSIPLYATQSLAPYLSVRFELSHSKEFLNPDKDRATLSPPHIHNCIEIFFNVSGDASFLVNNRLYPPALRRRHPLPPQRRARVPFQQEPHPRAFLSVDRRRRGAFSLFVL